MTISEKVDFEQVRQQLRQTRDELQLKIHLASLEIKDEWEKTQAQLEDLEVKIHQLSGEAKDAGHDLLCTIEKIGGEIESSFARIKRQLEDR